jgi:diguanylate cyclase (GGDEF)-like protein/PAS domain S-box-containing protein
MMEDQEIYRTVLAELPVGVYFVDREHHIAFWNHGAEEITGYLSQQVLGRHMGENFLEHVDQENRRLTGTELPLMAALRDGKSIEKHVTVRHKDGHPVQLRLRAVPLRNDSGRLVGAAEYFEPLEPQLWQDERKNVLEIHGCMDSVTGAMTRSYTETQLQEHFETFERHRVPFGVLAMQVDGLDELKAKHGAGAVSQVMKLVGHTLLNGLRTPDQLGRWTDSEFLIVAAECGDTEAARVGERLRKIVSAAEAAWWGDPLRVTLSCGAAAVKDSDNAQTVVERAEWGLQRAVADGGNRLVLEHE